MVPAMSVEGKKTKMISALLPGVSTKGEDTHVAAFVHDESGEGREDPPQEIKEVFQEFKDVMPPGVAKEVSSKEGGRPRD